MLTALIFTFPLLAASASSPPVDLFTAVVLAEKLTVKVEGSTPRLFSRGDGSPDSGVSLFGSWEGGVEGSTFKVGFEGGGTGFFPGWAIAVNSNGCFEAELSHAVESGAVRLGSSRFGIHAQTESSVGVELCLNNDENLIFSAGLVPQNVLVSAFRGILAPFSIETSIDAELAGGGGSINPETGDLNDEIGDRVGLIRAFCLDKDKAPPRTVHDYELVEADVPTEISAVLRNQSKGYTWKQEQIWRLEQERVVKRESPAASDVVCTVQLRPSLMLLIELETLGDDLSPDSPILRAMSVGFGALFDEAVLDELGLEPETELTRHAFGEGLGVTFLEEKRIADKSSIVEDWAKGVAGKLGKPAALPDEVLLRVEWRISSFEARFGEDALVDLMTTLDELSGQSLRLGESDVLYLELRENEDWSTSWQVGSR